jgi:hypothetical protein
MYYLAKVKFQTVNDETGRIQKTTETYLVDNATSISKAEEMVKERFKDSMADFSVIEVKESNIMGIIDKG